MSCLVILAWIGINLNEHLFLVGKASDSSESSEENEMNMEVDIGMVWKKMGNPIHVVLYFSGKEQEIQSFRQYTIQAYS